MISKLREKVRKSSVIAMLFFTTFITALILSFNAVADIDAFRIVGAEVSARDTGVSGTVTDYDADSVESDTVFHHVGDTITYNLSVKNQHDKKYKIITITDDNNNPSILYNYDKHEGEEVAGGASFDLVVTAEYASGVASLNDRAQHLSVRFTITYEEVTNPDPDPTPTPTPSDEGDSSNPNTGDRLPIYITVLIASMIGLIVCIWRIGHDRSGRKKHYNGRKIIVCLLIASALIPVAAKALTEASDFVLATDYEFMDQLEITMEVDGTESVTPIAYGSTVGTLPVPSKDNFGFVGWKDESNNLLPNDTVLTEDTKLMAVFERVSINAHFTHNNETTGEYVVEVPINSTLGSNIPAGPSYAGHVFDNWYTLADGGDAVDANTQVYETDVTYYAHWLNNITSATANPDTMELFFDVDVAAEKTQSFTIVGSNLENYTISSSDESVATVSGNTVTGVSEGTANIIITGTGSHEQKTIITVNVTRGMRTVNFNYNDGTDNKDTVSVHINSAIGSTNIPAGPTREHYGFAGWFTLPEGGDVVDGNTVIGTEDADCYAHWTVNKHNVSFSPNYENAPAAENILVDWNTTIGSEPTAITRAHYTFDGWYDDATTGTKITSFSNIVITADTTYYAHWIVDQHTVTFSPNYENAPTAQTMTVDWNAQIGAEPTAITREHYTLDGWYDAPTGGNKINSFSGIVITADTTYYAHWTLAAVTITFVYQNGATPDRETRSVNSGDTIDSFPAITYEGFNLIGWFDDPTGGNEVDTNTVVNSDITVYAHWGAILCKKTTEMHVHTCDRSDSGSASGCKQAGYAQNDIITFGNIASSTLTPGDAYDCDMNGNGVFGDADPTTGESTERFYYLRTIDNNRAALIFYANYEGANGPGSAQQFTFGEIDTALPSSSVWSNAAISFNGSPSRIPLKADIIEACGSNSGNNYSVASCEYILENTAFVSSDTNYYQNGVWVENNTNRYMGHTLRLISGSTNKNGVRPVIEVPLVQMEQSYHIEYDVGDGTLLTGSQHDFIAKGSAMGTLPTFAKTDYISDGWYTANGEAVDENYVPTADMTLYAHYKNSVAQAVIANPNISVNVGETEQIVITNASEIGEAYIFTPSDQTIADVTTNGGLVTGTGEGDTTITLVGITSGRSKVINVHVVFIRDYYIVNLNENGGDPISATYNPLRVPKDNAVSAAQNLENGDFPTTQYSGHNFDGWYADSNCNVPVSLSTIVSEDTTYYAKWIPVNAIAEVVKSDGAHQYPETIAALNTSIKNSSGTTDITILKDITLTNPAIVIHAGHDVVLDLNGHTLSHPSTSGYNVIQNWGTVLVRNGTITTNANKKGAIDCNDAGSVMILEDLTIMATNNRQAVYNSGGDVTIRGNSYFHNTASNDQSTRRGAVQNHCSQTDGSCGVIRILSGTIVAENQSAVKVEAGTTVIIGTAGGGADTTSPVIQGKIYGVETAGIVEFYDGIIKGYSAATDDANGITTETGLTKTIGSEVIDGLTFETMYLVPAAP